jgi:hypothetical protein
MPPMASEPPALGWAVVGRRRARLKIGGTDGFWKLLVLDSYRGVVGVKDIQCVYDTCVV